MICSALSACGGSSSGGGGGGAGTVVYSGPGTFFVAGPGGTGSTPVTITVTVSGNMVTVTDGADSGTAPLSADGTSFVVPINVTSDPSLTCSAPLIASGTIMDPVVNGTFSGSASCSINGGPLVRLTFSGSFRATRTTAAKALRGSGMSGAIKQIL